MKLRKTDFVIAGVLALSYFVLLGVTSRDVGYVRDEGHYFHAGSAYARWFEALWDDVAVVKLKSGEEVRGGHLGGSLDGDLVVRTPQGRRSLARAEVAAARLEPHPDRGRVFERGFMDSIWRENFEHPALMKSLFVLSYRVFHERLGWLNMGDSYRLPAWAFAGLLLFLLYLWGTELYDRKTGLFAALSLGTMPHVFFHAHLACFDVPVVTMWVAVLYAFWKSQKSTYWAITCGTVFAVALATKHNTFFLPFILLAYWVASRWRELSFAKIAGVRRLQLPTLPLAFFTMVLLAPVLYYALWPHLWHSPWQKFGQYLGFHMNHEHYDTPYLGAILKLPPFPIHFPFVMSFLTIPELTVLTGGVGFGVVTWQWLPWNWLRELGTWWRARRARRAGYVAEPPPADPLVARPGHLAKLQDSKAKKEIADSALRTLFPSRATRLFPTDQIELLMWLGCIVPFAIIAHPQTPIFGGTKHWMNGIPFVALFAAVAMNLAVRALAARLPALARRPNTTYAVLAALVLAPSVVAMVRVHPYGTGYHNLFAGGLAGPVKVGNTIQFWGPTLRNVADWLNANAEPGAGVCHHEANSRTFAVDQRDGLIRRDLVGLTGLGRDCQFDRADYYVYQHMQEYQQDEVATWREFGTVFPAHVVGLDGMLVVSVYKKPVRLLPEGAERGEVLYGRAVVGSWTRAGDALSFSAWHKNGTGKGTCEGTWRAGTVERPNQPAVPAADPDAAYRTLIEGCFGSRLPR